MYGSARWMLCLCIALTIGEAVTYGVVFGIPKAGLVGKCFDKFGAIFVVIRFDSDQRTFPWTVHLRRCRPTK